MRTSLLFAVALALLAGQLAAQDEAAWCFGFESTEGLTIGWGTNSDDVTVSLNTDAQYVGEGEASARLSATSQAEAEGNHYVSLMVPAPDVDLTDRMLTFSAWTSLPETTPAFYVRAYDAEGEVVVSWQSWRGVLGGSSTHTFELQPGLSMSGLNWEEKNVTAEGRIVQRFEFIMGASEKGAEFDMFIDNLCVVPARYKRFADITEPKKRHPITTLVEDGKPAAMVVRPEGEAYDAPVLALVEGIREASGAELPVQTDASAREDLAAFIGEMTKTNVVLIGQIGNNRAMLPIYSHSACFADDVFPGEGGHELRIVHDPWGTGKNVVVIGATDAAGATEGVNALLTRIEKGDDIALDPIVDVKLTGEADTRWGKGFAEELGEAYLERERQNAQRRIETGAHQGLAGQAASIGDRYTLTERDDHAKAFVWVIRRWKEHRDSDPGTYGGPWGMDADFSLYRLIPQWDAIEESPAISDEDRLDVSRILFEFTTEVCVRKAQGTVGNERVRFNHQTFPALGLYYAGEYFSRHYDLAESQQWLGIAEACFGMQAKAFKPYEDCNGYQWLTLGHLVRYALAKPDFTYFENGNARRDAELAILSMDNLGYQVTYGDTGAFTGWWSEMPLLWAAAWYYDDAGHRWTAARKREVSGRVALGQYESGGEGELPTDLIGASAFPLDPYYYRTFGGPAVLPIEAAVDKVVMREGFDPADQYLLLDGLSNGGHKHYDGNSISRWTENGRIWLADADYIKSLPKYHNGVLILRDGSSQTIPDFCELERMSDMPNSALSTTTLRNYAGVDWRRHILWLKGHCYIVADQMIARDAGSFSFRPIWQTVGEVTEVDGGMMVTQDGQHAAIVSPPTGRSALSDDPHTGRNWSAYEWAEEPVVRRLQQVYSADLQPGHSKTLFTILRASGETTPSVKASSPAEGFLYAEVDGTNVMVAVPAPGEELKLLDLTVEADALVATPELISVFGLRRLVFRDKVVWAEAPVDLEMDILALRATVHAEEGPVEVGSIGGAMSVDQGTTQHELPAGAMLVTPVLADLFARIARIPDQDAEQSPVPEGLPELRRSFDYRESLPAYLLTNNRGAFEAVDTGAKLSSDPAPLERNVFGKEGDANAIENAVDGDLASTAGCVMWDSGQTVIVNIQLDRAYDISSVVVRAWYATSSSKGKVFQVKSIRVEGSNDAFEGDARTLGEMTDLESRPNWGGDPRVPHAYELSTDARAKDLRLTIVPRSGDEVEGEGDPSQCGVYIAELEVWGNREGLDASALTTRLPAHTFRALATADVDGDGNDEIIAGSTNGKVYLFGGDGAVLWSADMGASVNAVAAVGITDDGLSIIAGCSGGAVKALGPDGSELWTFQAPYYKRTPHVRTVFGATFGEGKPAVIAGCDNWRYYAISASGEQLWHYESVHGSTAGAAGDIDGDGVDEVACGTEYYWWHLVSAEGSKVWSYSTSTGPTANACAIGDLDGDGKREVLFGGADSNVHVIGSDGKLLWQLNTGDEVTALACADVDGDGSEEAIVGSLSFNVYALKGDGSLLWRQDVGSPVVDLCLVSDNVCALTQDGRVCTLDMRTGDWAATVALGAPGLRIVGCAQDAIKLVATTEDGDLHGLTW